MVERLEERRGSATYPQLHPSCRYRICPRPPFPALLYELPLGTSCRRVWRRSIWGRRWKHCCREGPIRYIRGAEKVSQLPIRPMQRRMTRRLMPSLVTLHLVQCQSSHLFLSEALPKWSRSQRQFFNPDLVCSSNRTPPPLVQFNQCGC
jgi:hypothetical protein